MAEDKTTIASGSAAFDCARPVRGPKADYFPNVVVFTHENIKMLFYDDLLRGKTFLINLMSIKEDAAHGMTRNLAKVQDFLGDRLGRDVFMYSVTTDPRHDTPRALSDFAEQHGARPGWLFLTGQVAAIDTVRNRLFASWGGHDHVAGSAEDCSLALVRYGNEAAGIWGSVPGRTNAEGIAERIVWVSSRDVPIGPPKRRGPAPIPVAQSARQPL